MRNTVNIKIIILLLPLLFLSPSKSLTASFIGEAQESVETMFYQYTVKEEVRVNRVIDLLRGSASHRAIHLDYLNSAIIELEKAIAINQKASILSPFRAIRFSDMESEMKYRLRILSEYYDYMYFRDNLKTSSRYIYGGELVGSGKEKDGMSKYQSTIASLEEISNNIRVINNKLDPNRQMDKKSLKYLDKNKRML